MQTDKIWITGPFMYSEWVYEPPDCLPKRIILFGEKHAKPICPNAGHAVMPMSQFLATILQNEKYTAEFTFDVFVETEYKQKQLKVNYPRGYQITHRLVHPQFAHSEIFSITQRFKDELRTLDKQHRKFRIHYIDYRTARQVVSIVPDESNEPWASIQRGMDRLVDFVIESNYDSARREIVQNIIPHLKKIPDTIKQMVEPLFSTWISDRIKRQYPNQQLRDQVSAVLTDMTSKIIVKISTLFGELSDNIMALLFQRPPWSPDDIQKINKPWDSILSDLIQLGAWYMDMYALGRILRCFPEHRSKPNMSFVYAGGKHIETYEYFFRQLGLKRINHYKNSREDLCLPIDKFTFYKILNPRRSSRLTK